MKFNYSRHKITGSERIIERALEVMPGAISWSIIIGMVILSYAVPLAAAVAMIAFILYWVMRLLYMNIFLILSYIRLKVEQRTDWMWYIEGIDKSGSLDKKIPYPDMPWNLSNMISAFLHSKQLENLQKSKDPPPNSKEICHLVIIPVIKEGKGIVEAGVLGIAKGKYPSKRILLVIAAEDSASAEVKAQMQELQQKYRKHFLDFLITIHPNNLLDEARVKGANASYAARCAAEYFGKHNIPFENIIVSCFDADTVPTPNYFSCLAYHYMITPNRTKTSYQPIPVYYNNIWDVPSFARIIDIGTSFFQLVEATNPRKLVTFSSHSMSFKALVDIGYWPADMISDDSAIFWKAFIFYDGEYRTIPIYTTVSMDIVTGRNLKETFLNIYKQKRRWAWGVENFPIVARALLKSRTIPLYKKFTYSFKLLDSFVSWATWSFLLAFGSWLPGLLAGKEFASTTVFYIAPRTQRTIFSLASFGIIICIAISLLLLPHKKAGRRLLRRTLHALEWVFIPAVILVLSALPALDAQTRLMFGKYMEFWVTDKRRKRAR